MKHIYFKFFGLIQTEYLLSKYSNTLCRIFAVGILLLSISYGSDAQTAVERGGFLKTATVGGKTYVCNSSGVPFSMAGVDMYWSQWDPKFWNAGTVNYFVDNWKISVIRCAVGVAYTPDGYTVAAPGGIITDYTTNVNKCKAVVDQAIARGIYVILDWHVEGKASPYTATAKQFFKEMAQTYGSHPNIIYEVYNEPARDGNDQASINAYDQEMVDYIRQYDNKNLIICGSNTWSQYPNQVVITGPNAYNICYTFHAYPDNESSHLTQFYNNVPAAQNSGRAVFITELSGKGNSFNNTAEILEKCKEWKIPVTTWEVMDNGEDWSIFCQNSGTSCLTSMGQMFKTKISAWPVIPTSQVIHPTGIVLNPSTITLPSVGASAQLSVGFTPSNATNQSASYVSSNSSIVSVSATGLLTAKAIGTATITANASDNTNGTLTSICVVTVKNVSNIAVGKPATATSTESTTYSASKAVDGSATTRWSSSFADPQEIQIDLQASYKISQVSLNWEAASAKDYTIQVSSNGTNWTTISNQIGKASGARVDDLTVNGVGRYIKLRGTSRTTVYGYSLFEFAVYGELDAVVLVTGVTISPSSMSINVGSNGNLTANISPANASNKNVTWSSNNTSVATVNSSGVVSGISAGNAIITAITVDGAYQATRTVTVSGLPTFNLHIEAENYNYMSGIQTETCSEGGLNVGWTDAGDWMSFENINIPSTGVYTVKYRVASATNSGTFNFEGNGGAINYGSVNVSASNSSGWQNWKTISKTVNLTAGIQNFGIGITAGGFNINWFEIISGTAARLGLDQNVAQEDIKVELYPNPASEFININGVSAFAKATILSIDGKVLQTIDLDRENDVRLTISNLEKGIFILRLSNSNQSEVHRFIKR